MLFIVNELKNVSTSSKFGVEFREVCEHDDEHKIVQDGYAFRVYNKLDVVYFTKEWLSQIGRTCELSTFKTTSDVVNRYNDYIARGGNPVIFDEASVRHGKVFSYHF